MIDETRPREGWGIRILAQIDANDHWDGLRETERERAREGTVKRVICLACRSLQVREGSKNKEGERERERERER